jgi:hypothetical protein
MRPAFHEYEFAGCVRFTFEEWQLVESCHFREGRNLCGGEQCGCEIFAADQSMGFGTGLDDSWPANEEGYIGPRVIEGSFSMGQCGAVVSAEDDQSIIEHLALFEDRENFADGAIESIYLGEVVSQLLPEFREIGPVGWQEQ